MNANLQRWKGVKSHAKLIQMNAMVPVSCSFLLLMFFETNPAATHFIGGPRRFVLLLSKFYKTCTAIFKKLFMMFLFAAVKPNLLRLTCRFACVSLFCFSMNSSLLAGERFLQNRGKQPTLLKLVPANNR